MEYCPTLDIGVVAIEKGAFKSPSTKVTNFTYLYIQEILARIYKHVPTDGIYRYCSVNKQYLEGVPIWKKCLLEFVDHRSVDFMFQG